MALVYRCELYPHSGGNGVKMPYIPRYCAGGYRPHKRGGGGTGLRSRVCNYRSPSGAKVEGIAEKEVMPKLGCGGATSAGEIMYLL